MTSELPCHAVTVIHKQIAHVKSLRKPHNAKMMHGSVIVSFFKPCIIREK
jgi:hypothetical protein